MTQRIKYILKKIKWWDFWLDHFDCEQEYLKDKEILEIGSGHTSRLGVVTLDFNQSVEPDILHNLDKIPWPIMDSHFDVVLMFSVIEHVENPLKVIEECYRILKPNGKIYLLTPHFSATASYTDLSHRWHFSGRSFDYFISGTTLFGDYGFYSQARFVMDKRLISLHSVLNYIPFLQWISNKYLEIWEDYFCFIVRGGGIYLVLQKKDEKI